MSKLIFILTFFFAIGQINAQTVEELVESLSKAQILDAADFVGRKSEQFKTFERLKEIATIGDLLKLTNHENPVIACYTSWELIDKNYNRLDFVFKKFQERNEKFQIVSGCEGEESTLSEALYLRYFNKIYHKTVTWFDKKVPVDSQLFKLDSLILFNDNVSEDLLNHAFQNNIFDEKFLDRIKFIAFEKKKFVAMKYIFNNHRKCCEEKLPNGLLEYLGNNQYVHRNIYREIFYMLLSYDDKELRKVTLSRLKILFAMGIFPTSEKEYEAYLKK